HPREESSFSGVIKPTTDHLLRGPRSRFHTTHKAGMKHTELRSVSVRRPRWNAEPDVIEVELERFAKVELCRIAETRHRIRGPIGGCDGELARIELTDLLTRAVRDLDHRPPFVVLADAQHQRRARLRSGSRQPVLGKAAPYDVSRPRGREPARLHRHQNRLSLVFILPGGCRRRISSICSGVSGPSSGSYCGRFWRANCASATCMTCVSLSPRVSASFFAVRRET